MTPLRPAYTGIAAVLCAVLFAAPAFADLFFGPTLPPPENGGFTRSMGMPSPYVGYAGVETQAITPSSDMHVGGMVNVGAYRYIGSPVVGIGGIGYEFYGGASGSDFDGGIRGNFFIPSLLLGFGADYNIRLEKLNFLLRYDIPIRRGGVAGRGSTIALRWLPGRDNTISVGLSVPFGNWSAGNTRPKSDYVLMDKRKPDRLEMESVEDSLAAAVEMVKERARWIARMTQPFAERKAADPSKAIAPDVAELKAHIDSVDGRFPSGHTLPEEIRVYHEELERAFSIAASGKPMAAGTSTNEGRQISQTARRFLLERLLNEYNYDFGQWRKHDTLSGLVAVAQTYFARWILSDSGVEGKQRARECFYVYQSLCDVMEEVRATLRDRWQDTRLVWMPLQFGFKPEEHDTQVELNEIIEKSVRRDFANGNRFWYIINEQFQWEMGRSVRLAEDYHVLWIHDYSGRNHHGDPDEVAYAQTLNYLTALVERVRAYDDTGKLPMYFIFLDEVYYEGTKGWRWLRVLENPMKYRLRLPSEFEEWEDRIRTLQMELVAAVEGSQLLQLEKSQYGDSWLKNRIRVHVNVTNPADPSFLSYRVIGKLPIPDNNMRDHRKIVFYDITEEDPYKGMAMFTGMGIGEHYVGSNWEDRAVMMQGPAALATKDAARNLLTMQGFEEDEIPFPFRPLPIARDYEDKIDAELATRPPWMGGDEVGILELHNGTGFTTKPINVLKAIQYSMMPAGSVLKVPDSLWQSHVYASLMAGSALRGCRSLVIAPTLESAPSAGAPQMARASGLMGRLLVFGNEMDSAMEREGGILRVGLYAPKQGVGDIASRFRQATDIDADWIPRVYTFHPDVSKVARNAQAQLDSLGYKIHYLTAADSTAKPKLHLKANFFASKAGWDKFLAQPEWAEILREYIAYLASQLGPTPESEEDAPDVRSTPEKLSNLVHAFLGEYLESLSPQEREEIIFYLTVGSTNMDYRSMVMNGEVQVTLSGLKSLVGVLDFVLLAGLCEWPETVEEMNALLPPPGWFTRSMSSFIKLAL